VTDRIDELVATRTGANRTFFETEADRIARCCHEMAERFMQGGRLLAFGLSPTARSDARHVAVEFVHPVIVGKRALPAIALTADGGSLRARAQAVVEPADIVIAFGLSEADGDETRAALQGAGDRGCLTVAFEDVDVNWSFIPAAADPFVRQELVETLYHVLWELVHVFFEHRGVSSAAASPADRDLGESAFLYPFLSENESDVESIVEDVRRSVLAKAAEVGELRGQTLADGRDALLEAATSLRRRLDAGGTVLAFGNGGSATDAMDLVADLQSPCGRDWPARRALDLTEDTGIVTAVANDIGTEAIFQRQLIAHGRQGDAAVALSTSGNSRNIIVALEEARRRELESVAFVGYDGGEVAAQSLADHVVVTRSQHIPRIQEAQASAYHALRELVELVDA
jgi:D-sedoheptulose 7-phosphate isomerase